MAANNMYVAAVKQNQQRLLFDQMRPGTDSEGGQDHLEEGDDLDVDEEEEEEEEGIDSPVDDIAMEEAEEAA